MHVLLVSNFREGTPVHFLKEEFQNANHSVTTVSDTNGSAIDFVRKGVFSVEELLSTVSSLVDFVLFVDNGSNSILPDTRGIAIPSLWFGIDTHNDPLTHEAISRCFDHTLLAQKSFVDEWAASGNRHVTWLPLAYRLKSEPFLSVREIDISHIGAENGDLYSRRKELLNGLRKEYENVHFGSAQYDSINNIYSRSKIVVNYSPMNDFNMRMWEAMGAGAVLLTNEIHANGLDELFVLGQHYFTYNTLEDLLSRVNTLLNSPDQTCKVGSEAMALVIARDTYGHRVQTIVNLVQSDTLEVTEPKESDILWASLHLGLTPDSLLIFSNIITQTRYFRFSRRLSSLRIMRTSMLVTAAFLKVMEEARILAKIAIGHTLSRLKRR